MLSSWRRPGPYAVKLMVTGSVGYLVSTMRGAEYGSWLSPGRQTPRRPCAALRAALLLLPVIQQPALVLRRMGAQAFLVGFGAPARPVRNDEVAVDDLGHM